MGNLFIIPDHKNYEYSLLLADTYSAHFAFKDFSSSIVLDHQALENEYINRYLERSDLPIGNVLFGASDIDLLNKDAACYQTSISKVHHSINIANLIGAASVVFHVNSSPEAHDAGLSGRDAGERNADVQSSYWRSILEQYPSIRIILENIEDSGLKEIGRIAENLGNEQRFSICIQYGDMIRSGSSMGEYFAELQQNIHYIEIPEFATRNDRNAGLTDDEIDWTLYSHVLQHYQYDGDVILNIGGIEKQIRALHFLMHHRIYPF